MPKNPGHPRKSTARVRDLANWFFEQGLGRRSPKNALTTFPPDELVRLFTLFSTEHELMEDIVRYARTRQRIARELTEEEVTEAVKMMTVQAIMER